MKIPQTIKPDLRSINSLSEWLLATRSRRSTTFSSETLLTSRCSSPPTGSSMNQRKIKRESLLISRHLFRLVNFILMTIILLKCFCNRLARIWLTLVVETNSQEKSKGYYSQDTKFGVVKRFEFSAALQRMSVLTYDKSASTLIGFVKGSPEMIQTLCTEDSLPRDFEEVLEVYTREGLRVLGMSYRILEHFDTDRIKTCKREEIE